MGKKRVAIIGAGLSGLITALKLSKDDFDITIFEKEDQPGGRMRTENVGEWDLDLGFQVALTGYPYLKKYINFDELSKVDLEPGATIFIEGKRTTVGDPTRYPKFLFPTLFSTVGSIKDKWLIIRLQRELSNKSIEDVFRLKNCSTLAYLKGFGFSDKIIDRFFRPFYAGIFLENELRTSSRMFLFIFKMFAEGKAIIPKGGIGKIGDYLAKKLQDVEFKYNTNVSSIDEGQVIYNDQKEDFDLIINTNPSFNKKFSDQWKGCHVFYFEHQGAPLISAPRIGLLSTPGSLINNIFYANYAQSKPEQNKQLLSITVVDDQGKDIRSLKEVVAKECEFLLKRNVEYVQHYKIPHSLPDTDKPLNDIDIQVGQRVIHIGDYFLNGSQNAACKIGEELADKLNAEVLRPKHE